MTRSGDGSAFTMRANAISISTESLRVFARIESEHGGNHRNSNGSSIVALLSVAAVGSASTRLRGFGFATNFVFVFFLDNLAEFYFLHKILRFGRRLMLSVQREEEEGEI